MNLSKAVLLIGFFVSLNTYASVPYFGPENSRCQINIPGTGLNQVKEEIGLLEAELLRANNSDLIQRIESRIVALRETQRALQHESDIDAGYHTSEDCTIVFVKPPLLGSYLFSQPFITNDINRCDALSRYKSLIEEDFEAKLEEIKGADNFAEQMGRLMRLRQRNINELDKDGANLIVARVSGVIRFPWNELLRLYEKYNPGRTIRPLPVSIGYLTARTVNKPKNEFDVESDGTGAVDVVKELELYGLQAPDGQNVNANLPDYLAQVAVPSPNSLVMGQTASFNMGLNLAGACSAFNVDRTPRQSLDSQMSATYTYFYPLQSKATFKVSLNEEVLEQKLFEFVRQQNGQVTAEGFRNFLGNQQKAAQVTINPGAFGDTQESKELETQYREQLTNLVLETFIATASQVSSQAVQDATRTFTTHHSYKHCRKRWWGSKSCTTHTYTVTHKEIDWDNVRTNIASATGTSEARAQSYFNIYLSDSSAFLNIAK